MNVCDDGCMCVCVVCRCVVWRRCRFVYVLARVCAAVDMRAAISVYIRVRVGESTCVMWCGVV